MMTMRLQREPPAPHATLGRLVIEGDDENQAFKCWTLEDPPGEDRGPIPAGRYRVSLYFSPRAQRLVPLLHNVPGRTMIEIHVANTSADVKGCIGVGQNRIGSAGLTASLAAFDRLMERLERGRGEERWIEILDAPGGEVLA